MPMPTRPRGEFLVEMEKIGTLLEEVAIEKALSTPLMMVVVAEEPKLRFPKLVVAVKVEEALEIKPPAKLPSPVNHEAPDTESRR